MRDEIGRGSRCEVKLFVIIRRAKVIAEDIESRSARLVCPADYIPPLFIPTTGPRALRDAGLMMNGRNVLYSF